MRYFRPSAAQHRPPLKRAEADRFAAGVMPFIKQAQKAGAVTQQQIVSLVGRIAATGMEIVKTEYLRNYDGRAGYTLAQGE